ncbi:GIY-YIG nuclease family protein [Bradyrhizobium guangxiense]|uniref:GIY-YIG nuclease family protein n=1 Tax=Bradyrhizobium guangxiense TaxID=1325115 RepID=UPI003221777F
MTDGAWLYILECRDGSYYIGTTRTHLEIRVAQHNAGTFEGYTKSRRPVTLIFSQWFDCIPTRSNASGNPRSGAARRRKPSCAAILPNSMNWQSAHQVILRDARLRRTLRSECAATYRRGTAGS